MKLVTSVCLFFLPILTHAQVPDRPAEGESQSVGTDLSHISTGVLPQHVYVDREGKYAAIFGQEMPEDLGSRRVDLYHGIPTALVIINLDSLQVLRREKISGNVRDVILDGSQLVWVPKNVNLIHRLEPNSDKPLKKYPFASPVLQLLPINEENIAVLCDEYGKATVKVFRSDGFRPINDHPLTRLELGKVASRGREPVRLAHPIGDGLLSLRGLWLINQNDGTTRCLVSRFYGTTHLIQIDTSGPRALSVTEESAWKRSARPGGMYKISGSKLYSWRVQGNQWDLSQAYPFVTVLNVLGRSEQTSLSVQIKDLITGRVVRETNWKPSGPLRELRNLYSTFFVQTGGRRVITTCGDQVYLDEVPTEVLDDLEAPLRLQYPQAARASTEKPISFTLRAAGGTPPYTFQLEESLQGLRLDSTSGRVDIDLPMIWKNFLEAVADGKRRDLATSMQMAKAGLSSFKSATGIEIDDSQFGSGLPLLFKVIDSAGQDDQVFINIPVVGSSEQIESALREEDKTRKQLMERRREERAKILTERRTHDRMAAFGLGEFWFFVSQAIVYGIYLSLAVWYVWPWMVQQPIFAALMPLCLVSAIRVIGTALLLPGVVAQEAPSELLSPVAICDAVTTVLGLVAILLLYCHSVLALPLTCLLALCGLVDTLICYYTYMKLTFEPAVIDSAYLVPVYAPTPVPIACLLLLVYLVKRPDKNLAPNS